MSDPGYVGPRRFLDRIFVTRQYRIQNMKARELQVPAYRSVISFGIINVPGDKNIYCIATFLFNTLLM